MDGETLNVTETNDKLMNLVDEVNNEDLQNSVATSSLHSTPAQISRPRSERWNIIARAVRGLKAKIQHGVEERDYPYIDENDDGVGSGSVESSFDGVTTPEDMSPKESVDLTDRQDVAEVSQVADVDVSEITNITKKTVAGARSLKPQPRITTQDEFKSRSVGSGDATPGGLSEALKNSLVIMLSAIYGIIIVVMGLVLPLAEIFASSDHPYFFEVFYIYLYLVSMAFLVYVYTYLLRKERLFFLSLPRSISRTLSRTISRTSLRSRRSSINSDKGEGHVMKPLVRYNSTMSSISQKRRRKIAYNPETSAHTGSFYLRVGVIGFGIGSMIHSALTFGHYFEVNHFANHCSDAVQAVKPCALLFFTFVQMYFIFMNSKMCVHKYKTLARFGLMHMSCTNICVWLRSIVLETLLVMRISERDASSSMVHSSQQVKKVMNKGSQELSHAPVMVEIPSENQDGFVSELSCNLEAMMGKIVENSSIYLYPCTIEYSLVCACVLYVMWTNVGEGGTSTRSESCSDVATLDSEDDSEEESGNHRMSVDCAGSSRGLFLGILLFVVVVVCVVCFYVLTSTSSHVTTGTLLGHISEEAILVVTFVATAIASYQMRQMHFSAQHKVGIEETLTLISVSGLGMYGAWSIIAAIFYLDTLHGRLTIITNLLMLIQAASQATFTMLALRASARTTEQLRTRPGRQCVTFLLVGNFALWVISTFETQRLEYNQTQVDFYGSTAWSIFSHISVPLGIYFRFHSTVNLSIVWKKAWKKKEIQHKGRMESHSSK